METPFWNPYQYVDSSALNASFQNVSGSVAEVAHGMFPIGGLVAPDSGTITFSGLTATVSLPAPFAILNSSGVFIQAHGTTNNTSNTTYTVPFSGLVPATGSVTAFLIAAQTTIQQNPVSVVGPPPGHPSYNPNFVPSIGYTVVQDSLTVSATTVVPDSAVNYELGRFSLSSASAVTNFTTAYQQRFGVHRAYPRKVVSSSGALSGGGNYILTATVGGLFSTLPPASGSGGVWQQLYNSSTGTWTINATPGDYINLPAAVVTSFLIPPYLSTYVWCDGVNWNVQTRPSNTIRGVTLPYTVQAFDDSTVLGSSASGTFTLDGVGQGYNQGFSVSFCATYGNPITVKTINVSGSPVFAGGSQVGNNSITLGPYDFLSIMWDGTNWLITNASPGLLETHGMVVLGTGGSSGYFTIPNNVRSLKYTVVGGGGAGGTGSVATSGTSCFPGGGGGAGGISMGILTGLVPGQQIAYAVGNGGVPNASPGQGGNGTTTTFGSVYSTGGVGGSGGTGTGGGAGGVAYSGVYNSGGSYGSDGIALISRGGDGGAPGDGRGVLGTGLTGYSAAGYGGGGGGGSPGSGGGGYGGPGVIVIEY